MFTRHFSVIIEVLSASTEAYDRGHKFLHYKSILSFTEYLLIAQQRPHVSQFIKEADNRWVQHEFKDLNDVIKLASLDCELALSDIYANVSFAPGNTPFS